MTYSGLLSCPVLTPYSVGPQERFAYLGRRIISLANAGEHGQDRTDDLFHLIVVSPAGRGISPTEHQKDTCLSARERSGQIEPWDHAVFKAGHGGDLVATKREYIEADPVANAIGGA